MSGTRNLKRFNAYEPGIQFNNQTYPLLEEVKFFYHAHCCQMQNHHYFVLGRRREVEENLVSTADSHAGDYKREAPDSMDGYVCVNTTGGDVVNVNNITDFQIQTASEFCTSENCVASLCGEGCTAATQGSSSALGISAMGISDIICVKIVPSSSLDIYYSSETFASQITRNICNTTSLSVMPSPTVISPSPSMSPTMSPSPPDPCEEPAEWCSYKYTGPFVTLCNTCVSVVCSSSFSSTCNSQFSEICNCYQRKRSAHEQNSPRDRNFKRSVNATFQLKCSLSVTHVICRKQLNCSTESMSSHASPMPAPTSSPSLVTSSSQQCDNEYSFGELLLPSGWFHPDLDSKDTICRENVTTEPAPTPTPTPTSVPPTASPQNECVRHPGIIPVDITTYVKGELTECSPEPDDFNPCEELLGDSDILRVAIWFVVLLALVGNGLVITVFIGYSVIIRRTKMHLFIMHFFYANLAVADLLMSVYLLTIAAVDVHTQGHFSEEDVEWRTGPGCGFAGFCAITSTMVSMYTLVVITAERLYTITFVMHKKNITKPFALVIMTIGWVFGICIGMLPLVGVNSYELVAICLPFDTTTTSSLVYVTFLLIITGLAFIFIAFSYGIIFYQVVLSPSKRKLVRSGGKQKKWKGELKMALRMFLLVFTNFVCWFPIALVSLTAAFGGPLNGISVGTAKIFVVFVFPLNACVNPFLYTLSTKAFKENFLILLSKCGLFRNAAQSAVQSRVLGFPTRSENISDTRRSSIFSRLIPFSAFYPNRRGSDMSQGDMYNSVESQRRSSQYSMGSNEESSVIHPSHQGSPFNSRSNDNQFNLAIPNQGFREGRDRPRHSLSTLGVLPEIDEVPVAPSPDASIRVNLGYSDQDDIQTVVNEQEKATEFNNGHLVNGDVDSVTMIANESTEPSFARHQIIADVLQSEGEHSDSPSTPDEIPMHTMRTEENNQKQ